MRDDVAEKLVGFGLKTGGLAAAGMDLGLIGGILNGMAGGEGLLYGIRKDRKADFEAAIKRVKKHIIIEHKTYFEKRTQSQPELAQANFEGAIADFEAVIGKITLTPTQCVQLSLSCEAICNAMLKQAETLNPTIYGANALKQNPQTEAVFRAIITCAYEAVRSEPVFQESYRGFYDEAVLSKLDNIEEGVAAILAKLNDTGETARAQAVGINEAALIKLAEKASENSISDTNQAFIELTNAVERLIELQAKAARGSNLDDNLQRVMREMAALSAKGEFVLATQRGESALQELDAQEERMRLSRLAIYDNLIETDLAQLDPESAAKRIVEKARIEAPDNIFDAVLNALNETLLEGERQAGLLLLQLALHLSDQSLTIAHDPNEKAMSYGSRGNVLINLGQRSKGEESLYCFNEAVKAFDSALELNTRDAMPANWALTQMNRAITLRNLGERASGEEALKYFNDTIKAYNLALEIRTRDAEPKDWAVTQMNRAVALRNLGERTSGEEALRYFNDAVSSYDSILEVWTIDSAPIDWAKTQMNRANALSMLGMIASDEEALIYLNKAAKGYSLALKVCTQNNRPFEWASIQANHANCLSMLGEGSSGKKAVIYLNQAKKAYDLTLEVWTRNATPAQWAKTQMNRAVLLANLGSLSSGDEALDYLQQAIDAYDSSLKVFTEPGMDYYLEVTLENKALAIQALEEKRKDIESD